jgi:hypothetical protein
MPDLDRNKVQGLLFILVRDHREIVEDVIENHVKKAQGRLILFDPGEVYCRSSELLRELEEE